MIPAPAREAVRACVRAATPWPLLIQGPVGTGKTCAALVLLDHTPGGLYYSTGELCDTLIRAQQGRLEWSHEGRGGTRWPEQVWSDLAKAPLVVLDELGARERVSDAHYDAVKRLLDERHGTPLLLLSNHDLGALALLYDDRIASRIGGGTVCRLDGPDRRQAIVRRAT
jgi:DNA replication protein DnaC